MLRDALSLLFVFLFLNNARADEWSAFRGGAKAGVAESKSLPDTWDKTRNVVWKVDVAGRGWSSPVVVGDKIFLTTVVSDEKTTDPKKGLYIDNLNGKIPPGEHRWLVLCLDFKTGKTLWEKEVHKGKPPSAVHIKNSYASETPVADSERVYCVFGNVGVWCLDHAGKVQWSKSLDPRKTQMNWGPAASPTLHKDHLFLARDNEEKSELIAYEAATGKEKWRIDRKETSNWATPFIWKNKERTELVTAGKGKVRSYDLDGKLLWELGGMSIISIPTPFAAHGMLYIASGYVLDPTRPVYAIKPGATGDITLPKGEQSGKFVEWRQPTAGPYHPTPLVYGDYLYVLYDRGMLSCYEAKTGKMVYEKQRLEGGGAFTASPWAYDGKVFCLSEDGDTFVIEAGKEFKLLGKNRLDEMTLATPALVNGSLLLRTMNTLYRIEKR